MKLDPTVLRNMNRQDFRVLAAVETGMKSHELVPAPLIASIANLRHGGTGKVLSSLLRDKLLSHDRSCGYDGYRLTTSGYDIMALENLKARGIVAALGDKIGTGKESDVYLAATPDDKQIVLKFHRLGRTSFRDVKKKRDYFNENTSSKNGQRGSSVRHQPNSWLFLSRISALKEYAFMKALYDVDYPTPNPIAHNRHIVAMGLVRGVPLYQVHSSRVSAEQAESIFEQSVALASRLGKHGLVHCDLNEFNLMVDLSGIQQTIAEDNHVAEHYVRHSGMTVVSQGALSAHGPLQKHQIDGTGEIVTEPPPEPKEFLENGDPKPTVTLIDFPQMVSTRHPNAKELYDRDLSCLKRFFATKLKCIPDKGWDELIPTWEEISNLQGTDRTPNLAHAGSEEDSKLKIRLDEELRASGYSEKDSLRDMELYYYHFDQARGLCTIEDAGDGDFEELEHNDAYADEDHSLHAEHDVVATKDIVDSERDDVDEFVDMGNNSVTLTDKGDSPVVSFLDCDQMSIFTSQTRAMAEEKAKARVRMHLDERKKKSKCKSAFQSRNNNKTFVKGKRVFDDVKF